MADEERSFVAPDLDLESLVDDLILWYESKRLDVERLQLGHREGALIQVRSRNRTWLKETLELITPFTVDLRPTHNGYLNVNVATSKWAKRNVLASFGAEAELVHVGGWTRFAYKWRGRTFEYVEQRLSTRS